jgi:hypothetical protein
MEVAGTWKLGESWDGYGREPAFTARSPPCRKCPTQLAAVPTVAPPSDVLKGRACISRSPLG